METRYLTLPEGRLAYDDQGTGPVMICMPGMGVIRQDYRLLAPRLVAAGYRVVTVDPRGEGESDTRWPDYSVAALGADLIALARALNSGPVYLAGGSMAAGAAVWAAAEAPELVSGLVLLAPVTRDFGPMWRARLTYATLLAPLFTGPWGPAVWRTYLKSLFPTGKPDDLQAYLARVEATLRQPGRMAALRAMIAASKAASGQRLGRVTAPALLVMGMKDRDFPSPEAEGRTLVGLLGGPARLELIEGIGHYPEAEATERTAALIMEYLASLRAQTWSA
jgi:pimeloyl-ACP methyl ester carboxylesterase